MTLLFFNPTDLNESSRAVLSSVLWIVIWWITEALAISVTALLPMILFPLTGVDGWNWPKQLHLMAINWFSSLWVDLLLPLPLKLFQENTQ